MARFSIARGVGTGLRDEVFDDCRAFVGNEAIELRDLLLREFPVESAPEPSGPDPDEVRRIVDGAMCGEGGDWVELLKPTFATLVAAARAYLRMREDDQHAAWQQRREDFERRPDPTLVRCHFMREGDEMSCGDEARGAVCDKHWPREQQPQQHPTIAQVVEACGGGQLRIAAVAVGDVTSWGAVCASADGKFLGLAGSESGTPEAALRKLYDDAVAKLKQQRDEAEEKLQRLGVAP